jgi:hypothetical protein
MIRDEGSTREPDRLTPLSELNGYTVAADDPDPRGWDVVTREGQRIGRVDELIVDPAAERARYLDVYLDQSAVGNRHVLVPTDAVRIEGDAQQRHQVEVGASMEYLASVTPYTGLPLTVDQEAEYRACPPAGAIGSARPETRIGSGGIRHD